VNRSEPETDIPAVDASGLSGHVMDAEIRESAARERREKLLLFLTNWQGLTGLILVTLFFASAIFAPWLAPYEPNALDVPARLSGPTLEHLAGTDQLGRDTLSRILYGGRVALKIAAIGVSVALVVGLVLGMIAGFGPRWLDSLLLLVFDTVRSFPAIVLALAMVALTGPSLGMVLAIVIITSIPQYARVARTATLSLRNTDFILAERSLGASMTRTLLHHVMPNVIGPLLILAAMDVPVVVTILNEGYLVIRDAPWMVIAGGIPLILTTLGFTFLGEALRDIFDPRMGKGR
jgi:peptide/nickel transport system permease protein